MKKYIIITALLFFLAAALLPVTYFQIDGMQDQVEVKETTLAGDASNAAGITLQNKVFNRSLLWDMTYEIDSQEKPAVRFHRVSHGGYSSEPVPKSQAGFSSDLYGGSSSSGSVESLIDVSAKPFVYDVAERTKKGKTRRETHLLREYCEYFPARFFLDMEGVHVAPPDAPESYFKLPIPEDYKVRISVTKNSRGDISAYSIDNAEDGLYSESSAAAISRSTRRHTTHPKRTPHGMSRCLPICAESILFHFYLTVTVTMTNGSDRTWNTRGSYTLCPRGPIPWPWRKAATAKACITSQKKRKGSSYPS